MGKDILRILPNGDLDYDGEEDNDESFNEMLEDWRFEINTFNY